MFNNSELKQRAKEVFKRFGYKLPLLVSFVSGILASGFSSFYSFVSENQEEFDSLYENEEIAPIVAVAMLIISVLSILWGILVRYPIMVGTNRFFLEHRVFGSRFNRLFWAFKDGRYLKSIKTLFIMELKIFLWSLLFIIPGVIKSYQYFMVPYILAENPNIETKRALELSKEMTKDEKFNIFLLQLSFIGWMLLCAFTCGIGYIFLSPYMEATFAELYQVMREKAHSLGISDFEELPGFCPEE